MFGVVSKATPDRNFASPIIGKDCRNSAKGGWSVGGCATALENQQVDLDLEQRVWFLLEGKLMDIWLLVGVRVMDMETRPIAIK